MYSFQIGKTEKEETLQHVGPLATCHVFIFMKKSFEDEGRKEKKKKHSLNSIEPLQVAARTSSDRM